MHADVIFNTFGPSDAYDASRGRGVYWNVDEFGSSANVARGVAASFVPSGNYALNAVSLALGYNEGTNNLAIKLVADKDGSPSGAVLEVMAEHPENITDLQQVVMYSSSLNPVMAAGSRYWLVVSPADANVVNRNDNASHVWFASGAPGLNAVQNYDFSLDSWNNWQFIPNSLLPAFRIEGMLVPEPSALWLLLSGGLGWLGLRGWAKARYHT